MSTTVISVRGRDRAELLADPNFVYVGRWCAGWQGTIWGNPFKVGMTAAEAMRHLDSVTANGWLDRDVIAVFDGAVLDLETVLELYQQSVLAAPALRDALSSLKGKSLGCWCGSWKPGDPEIGCHAVVLAKLVDTSGA